MQAGLRSMVSKFDHGYCFGGEGEARRVVLMGDAPAKPILIPLMSFGLK